MTDKKPDVSWFASQQGEYFSQESAKIEKTSGQSYKQFTLVNYDSRVVPDLKKPHIVIYDRRGFVRLTTEQGNEPNFATIAKLKIVCYYKWYFWARQVL